MINASYSGSPWRLPEKLPMSVLAAKMTSTPGTPAISSTASMPVTVSIMATIKRLSLMVWR